MFSNFLLQTVVPLVLPSPSLFQLMVVNQFPSYSELNELLWPSPKAILIN